MIKDKSSYTILIIEDNPGDMVIVEEFLYEQILLPVIKQASTFQQAMEMLSGGKLDLDIILLDISLSDNSGQHLISSILPLAKGIPIIILTGYADIEFSIKSITQGISDYLLKDDLNSIVLFKSILYSISRNKNNLQLQESEKRYSDLFQLSPQPMWVFDPVTLRFLQVNNATVVLYGYSEKEFMAMSVTDIGEIDKASLNSLIASFEFESNHLLKKTIVHRKKSGDRMEMEIFSTALTVNHQMLRSVVAIDVTERNHYDHKIIKAIIKTQEDERYEIGSELHDNVCQILAATQMLHSLLKNSLVVAEMDLFNKVGENIKLAIEEIRNISHRLAPAFLDNTSLEEAFKKLLENFKLGGQFNVLLDFDTIIQQFAVSLEIQLNLYRILQEQLKNILKYSMATEINVKVTIVNDRLLLTIADNGIGFNIQKVKRGIGLANIKRRAELFYGMVEINSSPGEGCEILVAIPLEREGVDRKAS